MRSRSCRLTLTLLFSLASATAVFAQVPTRDQIDRVQDVEVSDDPSAVLAIVGGATILVGDLMPKVEARIKEVLSKTEQAVPEDQLHFARLNLLRQSLVQAIQNKMMREAFLLDQVGTQKADKRIEADKQLTQRARQMFYETELPQLKKQYKVTSNEDLDRELRSKGSSLVARQREFIDAMMGHLYVSGKVDREPHVSFSEVYEYYQTHPDEYHRPTRAKWEQMSVLFSEHPDREEAYRLIWEMAREVFYGGNFQATARQKSEEPFAKQGGVHDWTSKGSLASEPLDQQIFSIPLDKMSEIIEDESGYHVIRVTERQQAGATPLSEVQDDIRAAIRQSKISESQREVLMGMQDRVAVWSLFHEDVPGALPLPEIAARRHRATKKLR